MSELLVYSRTFVWISLITFIVLGTVIFLMPKDYSKQYLVRSTIEVASALINDKQEALESPDQLAKQITNTYSYMALLSMADKNVSVAPLSIQQNLKATAVGRSVNIVNLGSDSQLDSLKEFQQRIIEQVIKEREPYMQALRDSVMARIATANRISGNLLQEGKEIDAEIDRSAVRGEDLRKNGENLRTELVAKLQAIKNAQTLDGRTEGAIRELREQIGAIRTLEHDIALNRYRLTEALKTIRKLNEEELQMSAKAQRELKFLSSLRVSLAPTLIPTPSGPRRLYLLFGALVVSTLVGFGSVVFLYNFGRRLNHGRTF